MSSYHWYPILGWTTFFFAFIIGIVLYANFKKLYVIFYLIAVSLYVFTAGFMIDVFNFEKFGILMTLFVSAVIFMLLGYYFSRIFASQEKSK